jgi:FixJ family two-component response regulator
MSAQLQDAGIVHVVDDDDPFRISVIRLLKNAGLHAVGYRSADELLMADTLRLPGCLLVDLCMPGSNGLQLARALRALGLTPAMVFMTAADNDVESSVQGMKLGAIDYITKPLDPKRLLESLRRAMQVDMERRAARTEVRCLRERYGMLTPRERDVLLGIVRGKLNKQLAGEFGVCERRIKAHRASMMTKLRVTSVPHLVRCAARLGLLTGTQ